MDLTHLFTWFFNSNDFLTFNYFFKKENLPKGMIKGSLTRDFRLQVFSWISVLRPLTILLGPFRIFSKIRRDIREWMFITAVNNTGDSTGVNDTGAAPYWATLHPTDLRCTLLIKDALYWASLHPLVNTAPYWATLFRKFAEIFANECLSPVSTTPAIICSTE